MTLILICIIFHIFVFWTIFLMVSLNLSHFHFNHSLFCCFYSYLNGEGLTADMSFSLKCSQNLGITYGPGENVRPNPVKPEGKLHQLGPWSSSNRLFPAGQRNGVGGGRRVQENNHTLKNVLWQTGSEMCEETGDALCRQNPHLHPPAGDVNSSVLSFMLY